jgi:hypothetical protein
MGIKDLIKVVGLMVVCFAGMAWLFVVILGYPVRPQLYVEASPKDQGYTVEELTDQIQNPLPYYQEHARKIKSLPEFVPPANNHLTEQEIHNFYAVVAHCAARVTEFRRTYVGSARSGFGQAMLLYGAGDVILNLCKIEAFGTTQMTEKEFDWVQKKLFETALFAINRKYQSGDITEQEKEPLKKAQEQICWVLGFYKDGNPPDYFPEKLDAQGVSRFNVELFLKFKAEVRFQGIDLTKVNFNHDDIMRAAQPLPE